MNLVEIAGFLGADAEERFTATGKKVISMRIATRTRQGGKESRDQGGKEGKDDTIWWRVSIWGDRFDKMVPYFRKGTPLIVIGEMSKPEIYFDKEGKPQISMTLTAEIIKFSPFGKSEKTQGSAGSSSPYNSAPMQTAHSPNENFPVAEEEMAAFGSSANLYAGDDLPF